MRYKFESGKGLVLLSSSWSDSGKPQGIVGPSWIECVRPQSSSPITVTPSGDGTWRYRLLGTRRWYALACRPPSRTPCVNTQEVADDSAIVRRPDRRHPA
ncbi:hypothetical protein RHA1_ro03523 [Rhodococcus jostii RHA1]|uniref:Uncharacterized protein n=1 Tax=Rhodococcus jostii (strain RHA1) TaxID=101510 RepID=Q0SAW0_RHOJR|nr:hypothetical protein RHA1_ro03523 [Rhodococcus jostii RHA1]